ncbi:hypothetical protein OPV22_000166 [Ensete ventricosum]|uniref:Uncharacterized protein n=1 Tax=Ensete ventricosum TaxID=4639 RepID=A0AAV8RSJ6_ENSVE|nr:hypothetical protein OPV22_000166 [Ensete ventricosum]
MDHPIMATSSRTSMIEYRSRFLIPARASWVSGDGGGEKPMLEKGSTCKDGDEAEVDGIQAPDMIALSFAHLQTKRRQERTVNEKQDRVFPNFPTPQRRCRPLLPLLALRPISFVGY